MGNKIVKCPADYVPHPATPLTCLKQCPTDKGFQLKVVDGVPSCVYNDDNSTSVRLTAMPGVFVQPNVSLPDLKSLERVDLDAYRGYVAEDERFASEFAVANGKIDKKLKIQKAFEALQEAENVRDESPQAYQTARNAYYTLVKGEDWLDEEKQRIAKSEVAPVVNQLKTEIENTKQQIDSQKKTVDVLTGVKDKVLSLRDDFAYSVGTFQKQIGEIQNQINIQRRKFETATPKSEYSFWDILLNTLIVISLCVAIYMVYTKLRTPAPPKNILQV